MAYDLPFVGVNHLEAHLYAGLPRGARPGAADGRAPRLGRPHHARAHGGPRPLRAARPDASTTPPARRSTRSPASWASGTPAVRSSTASPCDGDPDGDHVPPSDARRGLRLLLLRAQDGGDQPRPQATPTWTPPTWPRRSRRPSSTCWSPRLRRAADETGPIGGHRRRRGGQLAPPRAHSCARGRGRRPGFVPSRAMCTDNAAMVAAARWYRLAPDGPTPSTSGPTPTSAWAEGTVPGWHARRLPVASPSTSSPTVGVTARPARSVAGGAGHPVAGAAACGGRGRHRPARPLRLARAGRRLPRPTRATHAVDVLPTRSLLVEASAIPRAPTGSRVATSRRAGKFLVEALAIRWIRGGPARPIVGTRTSRVPIANSPAGDGRRPRPPTKEGT